MAVLIDKDGNKLPINYYELGQIFDNIIANLPSKEDYYEFRSGYKNFSPNFDYAIIKLGYSIDEPFGPNTKIVCEDGKIYCYHPSLKNGEMMKDRMYRMSKISINPASYDIKELSSGILDRDNNYYTIPGISAVHTTMPLMLVNNIVTRNKELYDEYVNFKMDFTREMCFLENYLGCIRLSSSINTNDIFCTYSGSMVSSKQKDYLAYLRDVGFIKQGFEVDTDKNAFYQSKVHGDK